MLGYVIDLVWASGAYLGYLFFLQIVLQSVIVIVKEYYLAFVHKDAVGRGPLGIPFIRPAAEYLGLTGDNSPKKRIVEHTSLKTYSLPFLSMFLYLLLNDYSLLTTVAACLVFVGLQRVTGLFLLFKFYTGTGKGAGFNLYHNGWRIIGIDIHAWQLRQHPVTGKPLGKDEQFFGPARPHIDIPLWNIHHWPWEQHDDHEKLEVLKQEASEKRAEKLLRKQAKKEARAEKVRQRTAPPSTEDVTSIPKDTTEAKEPEEEPQLDLNLFDT
eukprot:TRINITY_DN2861_c0_g1_i1.p1 TRINITY_DN2861_c0_g1~~TRINITY_DN2861_c0_g1_i1.p1  ORF type:complete len:283 (+),score=57.09 TRINITY_DN2861_c0_g1_i1:44-850(+)